MPAFRPLSGTLTSTPNTAAWPCVVWIANLVHFSRRLASNTAPLPTFSRPQPSPLSRMRHSVNWSADAAHVVALTGMPKVVSVPGNREQFFYICLDDKVRLEDVKFLSRNRGMLFDCRDVALDDETAANLALQCRLRTI